MIQKSFPALKSIKCQDWKCLITEESTTTTTTKKVTEIQNTGKIKTLKIPSGKKTSHTENQEPGSTRNLRVVSDKVKRYVSSHGIAGLQNTHPRG